MQQTQQQGTYQGLALKIFQAKAISQAAVLSTTNALTEIISLQAP
jgi:hypothetical protein